MGITLGTTKFDDFILKLKNHLEITVKTSIHVLNKPTIGLSTKSHFEGQIALAEEIGELIEEAGLLSTDSIDKLLTEFTDALNDGQIPDIKEFLTRCPEPHRLEFSELSEMAVVMNRNLPHMAADEMFRHLEELRKQRGLLNNDETK